MPFRDPLSFEMLRDIQARRKGDPDVKALLWEVFRMQATLLRVDQLSRSAMPWSGCMGGIWQEVVESLKHEPTCIKQRERVRPDHFPPHWK